MQDVLPHPSAPGTAIHPEVFVAIGICTNLVVPPHRYLSASSLLIGEDGQA